MKKTIFILIVTVVFLITACEQPDISGQEEIQEESKEATEEPQEIQEPEQEPLTPEENNSTNQTEEVGEESEEELVLPTDTYKINMADTADPLEFKFKINKDNSALVDSVTFTIKNFGEEVMEPVIVFYLGGRGQGNITVFEYDELPTGYKMIKTENVSIKITDTTEASVMTTTLKDGLTEEEGIAKIQKTYLASGGSKEGGTCVHTSGVVFDCNLIGT